MQRASHGKSAQRASDSMQRMQRASDSMQAAYNEEVARALEHTSNMCAWDMALASTLTELRAVAADTAALAARATEEARVVSELLEKLHAQLAAVQAAAQAAAARARGGGGGGAA